MNNNKTLLIGIAFCFFCFGHLLANVRAPQTSMSEQSDQVNQSEKNLVDILVPLQDIPEGAQLAPSMFKKVALSDLVFIDFEKDEVWYSKTDIAANLPVLRESVTQYKTHGGPLAPGYRVVTIRVNATSLVENWARMGAKVNVNFPTVRGVKIISAKRDPGNNDPKALAPYTVALLVPVADKKKIQLYEAGGGEFSLSMAEDDKGN